MKAVQENTINPHMPSGVDLSVLINWNSPFVFLGVSRILFFIFI